MKNILWCYFQAQSNCLCLASDLVVIPAGMTSVLQPLDVSINKPFKEQYEKWFCEPNRELTPTGKIKGAAPHFVVANWVSAAWKMIEGQ